MTDVWWRRLPERLLEEDDRLGRLQTEGLLSSYRWDLRAGDDLHLIAVVPFPEGGQELEVQFPARYPGECPSVLPRPYGTSLSSHQFLGSGVLCLELGPDNWHPRHGAADMLRSAARLLAYEEINRVVQVPIPSRHVDTLGADVRRTNGRLVVDASCMPVLDAGSPRVSVGYVRVSDTLPLTFWLTELPLATPVPAIPPAVASQGRSEGTYLRIRSSAPSPPTTVGELRSYIAANAMDPPPDGASLTLVLLAREGRALEARWILDDMLLELGVVPVTLGAASARLPPTLAERASTTRVGIVGLGSLGSKVAASLARAGVRSFALVDGDVFLPENVVRHDDGLLATGLLKIEAAKRRIISIASGPCTIDMFPHGVADASNASVHTKTLDALGAVDVLVDATANPDAFNALAALASDRRRLLVWGEVFEGGLGGVVGYASPDLTPCPSCVRAAFLAEAASWPPAPRSRVLVPYGAGDSANPVVATDADVTVLAGLLTGTVLDGLDGSLGLRTPVTLLGLRGGWIFDHPLETRAIAVRADDTSCPWCWTTPTDPTPELLQRAELLLQPVAHVDDPPQS